jgi:hypothetical protein
MPTIHHKYGGSNANIWINCAAAPGLIEKVPRRPAGPAAEHGTAQHDVMEALIRDPDLVPESFLGTKMANGIVIDEEHMGAINTALDAWVEIQDTFPNATFIEAERMVMLTEEAGGTADGLMVEGKRGAIIDFKFGQNQVDADSDQLLFYAVCARKSLPEFMRVEEFECYIIQPALEPVIDKTVYTKSVLDRFETTAFTAIRASKQPGARPVEGDWCKWCNAKLVCPAKTQRNDTLTHPKDHILDLGKLGDQAARLQPLLKAAEKWQEEALERIHHELSHGVAVPGWKLVNKRAVRMWKSEPEAILAMKRLNISPDKYMITSLISPNKAEELMKKKTVDELTNKVSSGTTVALADDKRPAVLPVAAVAAQLKKLK